VTEILASWLVLKVLNGGEKATFFESPAAISDSLWYVMILEAIQGDFLILARNVLLENIPWWEQILLVPVIASLQGILCSLTNAAR